MEKRFISGFASQWFGENNSKKSANEKKFANSIVFIKNDTNTTKGDVIFAQGAYFEMNNAADVENIINSYLSEGNNIDIAVGEGSKLVISAVSLASLNKLADADKTKLVEAQAVKDALTTPVNLTLTLDNGVASFAESFKTLEGGDKTATATTAVLKQGDKISFTNDGGLKISHATITLAADVTTTETLSKTNTSFDSVSYTIDNYGHVTGKTVNTVTLPATAFGNDNTEYTITTTTGTATNSVDVNLISSETDAVSSKVAIKGGDNVTVSQDGNGVITVAATASTILNTLNVTDAAVTNKYVSEVDQTNGLISVTRATLPVHGVSETAVDGLKLSLTDGKVGLVDDGLAADLTSKNITLETAETATAGYLKTYVLKQGTTEIGKIDLPKELVVTGGSVVEKEGEKYLRLTIANQTEPVDIAVKDLVDVYTAGNGIAISNTNVVSAKVKEGETYLKLGAEGLYTEGIDTAISDALKDLDTTKSDSAEKAAGAHADEVAIVTGVSLTQTDGLITDLTVTSGLAATKAYVDGKFDGVKHNTVSAPKATGVENYATVTEKNNADGSKNYEVVVSGVDAAITNATKTGTVVNQGEKGDYNFKATVDGLMTATDVAALMNESWAWGTIA